MTSADFWSDWALNIGLAVTVALAVLAARLLKAPETTGESRLVTIYLACLFAFFAGFIAQRSQSDAEQQLSRERFCDCNARGACVCRYPAPGDDPYQLDPPPDEGAGIGYRGM